MTISNSDRTAGPFIGNGVTTAFPFGFKVFSRADLLVARTDASGNETILTLDADFSVTLNSNQGTTPGGTVTLSAPLAVGFTLAMTSNIALVQSLDLTNNGGFYPDQINGSLDRIVVMVQQVAAKVGGSLNVGGAAVAQLAGKLMTSAGSFFVGFIHTGTGAVQRTVQDKLRERISVEDFGAVGDGVADDTAAINAAILASIKAGGFGTVHLQAGKRYNVTRLNIDGVIGLTIKGQNGGNVGNLSPASSGGSSMIVCKATTGNGVSFTGVAYHSAQITLEDMVLYANTTGYALTFDNVSQINLKRVTVTNAGGYDYFNGHGIRISNCYYVYADSLYVWKSGSLYTVGSGITIDMGSQTSYLGGLFNFTNCSLYGWATGLVVGNQSSTPSGNEGYANVNYVNSELNSNGQGACFYYGTKTATISGCYVEGNLQLGVGVYNKAANVIIEKNFFNNFSASTADVQLGMNGAGATYPMFYNVAIRSNQIIGVNKYGVRSYAGAGSSVEVVGNYVTMSTAGALGISLSEAAAGNLTAKIEDNKLYGFADGNAIAGAITRGSNNYEYDAAGTLQRTAKNGAVVYPAFVDFTGIAPNDPETTVITNTTAGARYLNGTVALNKHRRQYITLTSASTQNVRLMKSDGATQMALLTPGKSAFMWNDGTNEYASLLP